jgi:HNH endonuclease
MGPLGGTTFPPVGRCIYCGSTDGLDKEHIVPFSLGGRLVLPKASCRPCADITKKFEQTCARTIFGALRIRLGLPTNNPEQRPDEIFADILQRDGTLKPFKVPAAKFPAICIGAFFPSPGILTGKEPTNVLTIRPFMKRYGDEAEQLVKQYGDGIRLQRIDWVSFCALLAKIAHGYTVSQIGLHAFTHFLPDLILGKSDKWPHFIGGDLDPLDQPEPLGAPPFKLHELILRKIEGSPYLFVTIKLFRFLGMPRYHVVVGNDLRT